MMYPRLFLARNLLRQDGVIFVSIDDNEVANLRLIMDEIFGVENFVADFVWQKKTGSSDANNIAIITENILCFAKNIEQINLTRNTASFDENRYRFRDKYFDERGPYYYDTLDRGGLQYSDSLNYGIETPNGRTLFPHNRNEFVRDGWIWKWSKAKVEWGLKNGFVEFIKQGKEYKLKYKVYRNVDNEGNEINRSAPWKNLIQEVLNTHATTEMNRLFGKNKIFDTPKPVSLIKKLVKMTTSDDDIIIDFFAGSGTTAHAVAELNAEDGGNRRWILVQLPEQTDEKSEARKAGYATIADIALERIRRSGAKIAKGDTGFRVYKIKNSSFKKWKLQPNNTGELRSDLLDHLEPLASNASDENLLTELLLKSGISPMSEIVNKGDYYLAPNNLAICLSRTITPELFARILAEKPSKIILLDLGFQNSSQLKANLLLSAERVKISVEVV
jgi:adenine-specific DNA-methyltransferase